MLGGLSFLGTKGILFAVSQSVAIQAFFLIKKLVNFIKEHHRGDQIMFWSSLASCYYARITTNKLALTVNYIPCVPRNDNLPNIPQARPIKNFFSILSRKVYIYIYINID